MGLLRLTYPSTSTTAAGTYTTGPNAITPVLADPNNRLSNYATTLNDGALTITGGSTSGNIVWPTPGAIVYGTPLGPAQLNASASTPGTFTYNPAAGVVLGVGPQTLGVTFIPTGGSASSAQTAQVILVVNQATTTTTLTAINATTTGSVTLSATVSSVNGGSVTGSVQFLDGSTSLSSVTVSATGLATYSVVLSTGPHTLTAVYSGDVNNKASTSSALLQTVSGGLDFTLTANPTMLSLNAGQSGTVTLSVVAPGGFTGAVTFTCTGLPSGSTCAFAPATVQGDGTTAAQQTMLTIGLPSATSAVAPARGDDRPSLAGLLAIPGGLLGFCLLWQRRRLQRTLGIWILSAVCLFSVAIGCGAGSGSSPSGSNASPTGSYNALITATSPATTQKVTIQVTLTK